MKPIIVFFFLQKPWPQSLSFPSTREDSRSSFQIIEAESQFDAPVIVAISTANKKKTTTARIPKSDNSIALHHSAIEQNIPNYPIEGAQRAQSELHSIALNGIAFYISVICFCNVLLHVFKLRTRFRNCCVIKIAHHHPPPVSFVCYRNKMLPMILKFYGYFATLYVHIIMVDFFFSFSLVYSDFSCALRTHKIKVASPPKPTHNAFHRGCAKKKVK